MDYQTALKTLQAQNPKDNFLALEVSWDKKLILPFKDGIALLSSLNKAEMLEDKYGQNRRFVSFERELFRSSLMNAQEYLDIKLAALMNISITELQESREKQAVSA